MVCHAFRAGKCLGLRWEMAQICQSLDPDLPDLYTIGHDCSDLRSGLMPRTRHLSKEQALQRCGRFGLVALSRDIDLRQRPLKALSVGRMVPDPALANR